MNSEFLDVLRDKRLEARRAARGDLRFEIQRIPEIPRLTDGYLPDSHVGYADVLSLSVRAGSFWLSSRAAPFVHRCGPDCGPHTVHAGDSITITERVTVS